MCRSTPFGMVYSTNPWMDPAKPVDAQPAITQEEQSREVSLRLGHTVETIAPLPGLPDTVFAGSVWPPPAHP
jgi:N-dimethylarginine dimethylaminohydrolase